MGRSTAGKVPITNVGASDIKEILNTDQSKLSDTNIKASEFFIDGDKNNIYDNFIDEEYCAAESGTKKDVLTTKSYSWGNFRNYGGQEDSSLPEIYWKVVTDYTGENKMPETVDEYNHCVDNEIYPGITLQAPLGEDDVYNLTNSVDANSILERDDDYYEVFDKYLRLNTKVGIDYPEGYSGGEPIFDIKVTPFLGTSQPTVGGKTAYMIPPTISLPTLIAGGGGSVGALLNYFHGPFAPIFVSAAVGNALTFVSVAIISIYVFDAIWDLAISNPEVVTAEYQYNNIVGGIYNFNDISNSSFIFGFGNKNYGYDNSLTGLGDQSFIDSITTGGKQYSYRISDYNYDGTPFSASNLIDEFPTNNTKEKYLNMTFRPDGIQYDLDTPPPVINYLVELVPIQNCILSGDSDPEAFVPKPTSFVVNTSSNRAKKPTFNIITPTVFDETSTRDIYYNTPITFVGAKYSDFIGIVDEDNAGLFSSYNHITLNTDGGHVIYKNYPLYNNKNFNLSGNNISVLGYDVFGEMSPSSRAAVGKYLGYFYNEGSLQQLSNPEFRIQGNSLVDVPGTNTYGMRSYWQHTNDWIIDGGRAYNNSAILGSYIYQSAVTNSANFYIVELNCNISSGNLVFETDSKVYAWYGEEGTGAKVNDRKAYLEDELPSGLSYELGGVGINSTGNYRFVIQGGRSSFKLEPSEGFIGSITEATIQLLPSKSFVKSKRGSAAVSNPDGYKLNWTAEAVFEKSLFLGLKSFSQGEGLDIDLEIPTTDYHYNVQIIWGYDTDTGGIVSDDFLEIEGTTLNVSEIFDAGLVPLYNGNIASLRNLIEIRIYQTGGIGVQDVVFDGVTSSDSNLNALIDTNGVLFNSKLNFTGSGINYSFSDTKYVLRELVLNNCEFSTDSLDNLLNYSSVLNTVDVSYTTIPGDFGILLNTDEVIATNSAITTYFGLYKPKTTGNYNITWKNSDHTENIDIESLNRLILDLDLSASENGTLDISGDNPEITDQTALDAITNLENKGWNILYNTVSNWTYEGNLTAGFDSDIYGYDNLTLNIGSLNPPSTEIKKIIWIENFFIPGVDSALLIIIPYNTITDLQIEGVDYNDLVELDSGMYYVETLLNPFPVVGNLYDTKINYTESEVTWNYDGIIVNETYGSYFGYSNSLELTIPEIGGIVPANNVLQSCYYDSITNFIYFAATANDITIAKIELDGIVCDFTLDSNIWKDGIKYSIYHLNSSGNFLGTEDYCPIKLQYIIEAG